MKKLKERLFVLINFALMEKEFEHFSGFVTVPVPDQVYFSSQGARFLQLNLSFSRLLWLSETFKAYIQILKIFLVL